MSRALLLMIGFSVTVPVTQLLALMVMIRLRAAREMIIFKVVMILIP